MLEVEKRLAELEGDMVGFLRQLIQIPSVREESAGPGAPFGEEIKKALESVLAWGEAEGFRTRNVRGYAGHLEYGTGAETVGVLVHLDVVPVGDGWTHPPFAGEIENGALFGRGTVDDKGPAAAVLFALKALKDQGVPLKRKIRVILGCDEESNWQCMEEYFKEETRPELGFTPDADFPLVYSEKGMLGVELSGTYPTDDLPVQLDSLTGGTRRNIVPEYANASLRIGDPALRRGIKRRLQGDGLEADQIQVEEIEDTLTINARGLAAHGSQPQLGVNAIGCLVLALSELGSSGGPWELVHFLAKRFGLTYDGSGLDLAVNNQKTGPLTLNLGRINISGGTCRVELDMRYPPNVTGEELLAQLGKTCRPVGLTVNIQKQMAPHYVDPEHKLVTTLLDVYRQETGDDSNPLAIGGRTYATTLGTAVAFGPNFPGRPELAHQKDEHIQTADLMKCAKIYARAIIALAGEE